MQPHGTHSQKQSERLHDSSTAERGGRQVAAIDGHNSSAIPQHPAIPALSSHVPPRAAAGSDPVLPHSVASFVAGSSSSEAALPLLRCGVIGSGRSASRLISQLSVTRGCRVVSVLSKDDSRSAALRRQHPSIATVQSDQSAFLSQSELDAVFICSAVGSVKYGSHCALALACAERRKPTVVDRPFARSASEARDMQLAFERAQVPLLAHQPLRAMPAIHSLQHSIVALQRVTSISYSFSAPLSALTAAASTDSSSSSAAPSLSPSLPILPFSALASNGGPMLPFVCDLFDVLQFVLGAVSDVAGHAVQQPAASSSAAVVDGPSSLCESVLSCSFRCGTALGAAVWDLASVSSDDRLVLRGTGGDLTLPLYQPAMPVLQTAAGLTQITANAASTLDTHSIEAVQRLVDELRRATALKGKSTGNADREKGSAASSATDSSSGSTVGSGGSSSATNGSAAADVDVCLVTAAMAVRSLACADAALRSFYRLRTDAYWDRSHTWQSHVWGTPTLPK